MANERVLIGRRKCVSEQKIRNIRFCEKRDTSELWQDFLECYLIATENRRIQQLKQRYRWTARRYRMTQKQCDFGNWRPAGCRKLTAGFSSGKTAVRKRFVMDVLQQTALYVRNGLSGAAMVGLAHIDGGPEDRYLRGLHPIAIGTDVCACRKQTYAAISREYDKGKWINAAFRNASRRRKTAWFQNLSGKKELMIH